jgi:hypothetical protein
LALRAAPEFGHGTRDAVKKPLGPAILVDSRPGRNRRDRYDNRDICVANVDVDAQIQPAVFGRVRPRFDSLACHTNNVLELRDSIQRAIRSGGPIRAVRRPEQCRERLAALQREEPMTAVLILA